MTTTNALDIISPSGMRSEVAKLVMDAQKQMLRSRDDTIEKLQERLEQNQHTINGLKETIIEKNEIIIGLSNELQMKRDKLLEYEGSYKNVVVYVVIMFIAYYYVKMWLVS